MKKFILLALIGALSFEKVEAVLVKSKLENQEKFLDSA